MKRLLTCGAILAALVNVANADFSGPYDHSLWTLDTYGGDGSAAGASGRLELTGNNAGGRIITLYTIKSPGDGTFAFDWSYACNDEFARLDTAGYVIAGVVHKLAEETGASGIVSVAVLEGDMIGFFVDTSDGLDQPGVLTVTGFSGPTPSGAPVGACCFVQPGCEDGMFEDECIRKGGTYMGDGTTCDNVDCGPDPQPMELVLLGDAVDLSTLPNCSAGYPTIAFNSQDDEFLVVWEEGSLSSTTSVAAQRVSTAGGLLGDPAAIVITESWQVTPSTTYNASDNEYLLAWRSQLGWPDLNSTVGQRFSAGLTPVGSVTQLSANGVGFEGSVVHNPANNEYFLTARSYSPDPGGIFGSRIAGDTVVDSSIEFDTTQGMGFSYPAPAGQVAYNSLDSQYLSTWAVQAYPTWSAFNLRGRIANADGTLAGPPFEITFAPNFRAFYLAASVAFDSNAGRYLVAFGDSRPIPLRGQFVDRDGTLLGMPFELSDPMLDREVAPLLAFDPVNNVYLLTWCESPTDTPTQIRVRLLAADGTPLGDPAVLSTSAYHMPFICANSNSGGFLVAWRDCRNQPGSTDIYGQFIGVEVVCPGDLDGDLDVDLSDLAQLLGNYGTTSGATYEQGDMDGDGDVDLADLAALLAVYGTNCR